MQVRPIVADDLPFVVEMLYAAAFWRPRELSELDQKLVDAYLAQYHENWGRAGDTGFVAEKDGRPVGAAWYRFFTEFQHGDGYVDEKTPELAIAVVDGFRSGGIGRALMEALHAQARVDGLEQIGLSVDPENPAKRLYESLGYEEYTPDDPKGRMVLKL